MSSSLGLRCSADLECLQNFVPESREHTHYCCLVHSGVLRGYGCISDAGALELSSVSSLAFKTFLSEII